MVRSVLRLLSSEIRGMHHAAYILASFTLASSLMAFFRDRLLAHAFGASAQLDLYYAAFRIPDLLFVIIASLVSAYVLIPELESKRSKDDQYAYIDAVFMGFAIAMLIAGSVAYVLAPYILHYLFPTMVARGQLVLLTTMTRILLLQPIFLGGSNILAAVTQSRSRYILYAMTPLLYNAGIVFGVVFLYPTFGLVGLVWGAVIGASLHAGIQLPGVIADGFLNPARLVVTRETWRIIGRVSLISLPRTLALSASQIVTIVLVSIAGSLAEGSIAVFTFAFNIMAVPLAVIGASYSVAAFPVLAQMLSRGEREEFVEHVSIAARHILFWSIPATGLLIVLRAYAVRVILGSGAFDWTDTKLTAAAFALFCMSLSAQALSLLLVRAYYAAGRSLVPFMVNALTGICIIITSYALVHAPNWQFPRYFAESLLRVDNIPGTEVLALALAYSVATIGGTLILIFLFERRFPGFVTRIARVVGESIAAAAAAGVTAYGVLALLGAIEETTRFVVVFAHAAVAGGAGVIGAILMFTLLGSRECKEMLDAAHKRVWRVTPLGSAETETLLT